MIISRNVYILCKEEVKGKGKNSNLFIFTFNFRFWTYSIPISHGWKGERTFALRLYYFWGRREAWDLKQYMFHFEKLCGQKTSIIACVDIDPHLCGRNLFQLFSCGNSFVALLGRRFSDIFIIFPEEDFFCWRRKKIQKFSAFVIMPKFSFWE